MAVGLPENVFLTKLDAAANWARSNSLWPMPFATACCGIELMATAASRHDIARFGAEVMRFSPRQCDLLIVAGRVVMKMLPVLQRIWLQMPEPKWCISMGACACTGGVFDTYAVVQGVDRFIPVDIYVPGCPPRPEQLLAALIEMQAKIMKTGTITGREFLQRTTPTGPAKFDPDEIRRFREASPVEGLEVLRAADGRRRCRQADQSLPVDTRSFRMSSMLELAKLQERFGQELTESTFRDNRRIVVPLARVYAVLEFLKRNGFDMLVEMTAVDYLEYEGATDRFGVVYVLVNTTTGERLIVKTHLNPPELDVPIAYPLWKSADWLEREVYDMFGIVFTGHPDLRRILMPEEFTAFPLRKDYPLKGRGERHNFPVITRAES